MRKELAIQSVKLAAVLAIPLAFMVVPTAVFESGRSICLWRNFFQIECPGCGLTRAISHASHLHCRQAFQCNKLIVIVLPLWGFYWLKTFLRQAKRVTWAQDDRRISRIPGTEQEA